MANTNIEISFRRGDEEKYTSRWKSFENDGNLDYSYLQDAIYFSTDTGSIFLNGVKYSSNDSIEVGNLIAEVTYNSTNNTFNAYFEDSEKTPITLYLNRFIAKNGGGIVADTSIDSSTGQILYEFRLDSLSNIQIDDLSDDASGNIEEGDSINLAFSKVRKCIAWIDVD